MTDKKPVYLGTPHLRQVDSAWAMSQMAAQKEFLLRGQPLTIHHYKSPQIARARNEILCAALNSKPRPSILVMQDSDVFPTAGDWLHQLVELVNREQAFLCGVNMAIKDDKGNISHAVLFDWELPWPRHRLTQQEALSAPATFDAAYACSRWTGGVALLLCTGILAINLDLMPEWDLLCHFHFMDYVVKDDENGYHTVNMPEDWAFSINVQQLHPELRVVATREIVCQHEGSFMFPNDREWVNKENKS